MSVFDPLTFEIIAVRNKFPFLDRAYFLFFQNGRKSTFRGLSGHLYENGNDMKEWDERLRCVDKRSGSEVVTFVSLKIRLSYSLLILFLLLRINFCFCRTGLLTAHLKSTDLYEQFSISEILLII